MVTSHASSWGKPDLQHSSLRQTQGTFLMKQVKCWSRHAVVLGDKSRLSMTGNSPQTPVKTYMCLRWRRCFISRTSRHYKINKNGKPKVPVFSASLYPVSRFKHMQQPNERQFSCLPYTGCLRTFWKLALTPRHQAFKKPEKFFIMRLHSGLYLKITSWMKSSPQHRPRYPEKWQCFVNSIPSLSYR